MDEDSDPELPQPLQSNVFYVWNLRGHNFCDDHPVLVVFGKSANKIKHELLPARASEQGNVIGSVRIYMCTKKCN